MPKLTLTDRSLKRKRPATGQLELWDSLVPGFGLRISFGGRRTFFVMGRCWHIDKKTKKSKYGQVRRTVGTTATLTLAEARDKAREMLSEFAKGVDPKETETRAKIAVERQNRETFRSVADEFLETHAAGLRTFDEMRARLERDILPKWGALSIRDLTRADVKALVRNKAKKHPISANRLLALVRSIFNWALDEDLIDASPAVRVKPPGIETERERVLNDDELRCLWAGFDNLGTPLKQLFQILLLTGQRRGEVAGMTWAEIEGDTWRLPRERTKSKKGHLVPLSPLVVKIINNVPKIDDNTLVFASERRGDKPVSGWNMVKARLDKIVAQAAANAAGEKLDMEKHALPHWTIHDLRRSFATGLRTLGIDRLTVSKSLNHAEAGITKIYDRYAADPEKRRAMEVWARHIQVLAGGEPTDNVTDLPVKDRRA